MPRINQLKIRKFGNVAPGTELKFDPRGVVLLGRNGTGKTTLLELLASICKGDPSWSAIDDYDVESSITCADRFELKVTAKREQAAASPPADPATDTAADAMFASFQQRTRRTLRIEALDVKSGERTLLESNNHETRCTYPDGAQATSPIPAQEGWMALGLGAVQQGILTSLSEAFFDLFSVGQNSLRFDEGLDYFRDLTERGLFCIGARLDNEGHLTLEPTQTRLISPSCARLLVADFKRNQEHSTSGFSDSSSVKYLDLFCHLAGFKRARIGVELDQMQQLKTHEVVRFSRLRFSLERNGSVLHHDHLSFGQRRLLAFLHYHDSTPSLIIADELVNGMHHEWIAECLRLMQNSQAFLSSQNPLLFDFLTFESPEEVANRFVICELDEQHRFVWRNMSESDAVEFYETYKIGLQHVSEILRTRGYW